MNPLPIALTVLSNALYHAFQKLTPSNVNPALSLALTYVTSTLVCLALIPWFPLRTSLAASIRQLSWVSIALGVAIVGLELGFLLAYRAGWHINLAGVVSNVCVALLLIPLGRFLFREQLSNANFIGIALCVAGLALANWKG